MAFQKATKEKALLRLAIFSPSGGGKTMTSLRIATGMLRRMAGRIGLIDTEHGSSAKYADRFDFDINIIDDKTIPGYIAALNAAAAANFPIVIIDSGSHAWQELLAEVDNLANTTFKGNSWGAWSKGTPKQKMFVDAILSYPGHVIMTMRSKTEWTTEQNDRGKSKPVRVGLTPEQGKGIEYEFDMLVEMSTDHSANVIKDRTGKYQDAVMNKPDEKFGEDIMDWLNDGAEPMANREQINMIALVCRGIGINNSDVITKISELLNRKLTSSKDITAAEANIVLVKLRQITGGGSISEEPCDVEEPVTIEPQPVIAPEPEKTEPGKPDTEEIANAESAANAQKTLDEELERNDPDPETKQKKALPILFT